MSFAPWFPWWVILLAGSGLLVCCLWLAFRERGRRISWLRRGAMVLLLALAFLRPGVGGADASSAAAQLDVFFVVDTTSSVVAQVVDHPRPVRVRALRRFQPGSQALGRHGHRRAPRIDRDLRAQPVHRVGQCVRIAGQRNQDPGILGEPDQRKRRSGQFCSDRRDVRFHPGQPGLTIAEVLGDGEQTAATAPAPFDLPEGLVSGGAVLGYGTSAGGRMLVNSGFGNGLGPGYIQDYSTGADAVSKIDENMLRSIAQQLRVGYVHRATGDGIDAAMTGVQPGVLRIDGQSQVRAQFELTWIFGLGLTALAGWELFGAGRELRRLAPPAAGIARPSKGAP